VCVCVCVVCVRVRACVRVHVVRKYIKQAPQGRLANGPLGSTSRKNMARLERWSFRSTTKVAGGVRAEIKYFQKKKNQKKNGGIGRQQDLAKERTKSLNLILVMDSG
jgi:hypothetical protein